MPIKDPIARKEYERNRWLLPHRKETARRTRKRPEAVASKREYDRALRKTQTKRERQCWLDFRRKYGITHEERDALFARQGYRCASCGATEPGTIRGWHTDHDHTKKKGDPGFIRGILCQQCNVALGYVENDTLVANLQRYLGKVK